MARIGAQNPALLLREAARGAIGSAGGRGFVRFLPGGEALLVSDAPRRCAAGESGAAGAAGASGEAALAMEEALRRAGFEARARDGLLLITPTDERLCAWASEASGAAGRAIDWDSPLHGVAALAARWRRQQALPLTGGGRRLLMETLRLLWQPEGRVIAGTDGLRALGAGMLRGGDRSGMREAGCALEAWLQSVEARGRGGSDGAPRRADRGTRGRGEILS